MQGIRAEARDPVQARETVRVINETISELYNRIDFFDHDPGYLGTAARVYRATGYHPYALLPNGATTGLAIAVPVRRRWQRCGVRWTIAYTSNIGSTATFSIVLAGAPHGPGMNLTATADAFAANILIPGPAVAEDVLSYVHVDTTPSITTLLPFLSLRMVRADPDNNANELWILGSVIELLPQG